MFKNYTYYFKEANYLNMMDFGFITEIILEILIYSAFEKILHLCLLIVGVVAHLEK